MSAEPASSTPDIPDEAFQEALVVLCSLSEDEVEAIKELVSSLQLGFADAALHSGLVTQDQIGEATNWIQRRASRRSNGIIAEVLRRGGGQRRELVVWEGPKLDPSQRLIVAHHPNHSHSEKIRSLATEVLLRTRNTGGGAFAIVSPCADEGRSQLSAELAIALAQLGRRTLLVDADLRNPSQHELFGAENTTGLAQELSSKGTAQLHGVAGSPQLALMTSGTPPLNPLELLSGVQFEQLATEWRRNFEYIILDTPPAAVTSDAIAVASAVGNLLVLSRANVTPISALKEISRKLEASHARTLGAVIGNF